MNAKEYDKKGNDPQYHNTGSRDFPETPVSQFGSEETGGRRAVKKAMHNLGKVRGPGKLQSRQPSSQKTSFTP